MAKSATDEAEVNVMGSVRFVVFHCPLEVLS